MMPKDSRLVARILSLWDYGSFWTQICDIGGNSSVHYQKMPARKPRRSKPRQQQPDAPAPHYRVKARSKRPNSASNMTGGKTPQMSDQLLNRALRT